MQIEEEGEEGRKLRSVLRIPAVASSYLHALLLAFCERTYSQLALYCSPPDVQLAALRSFFDALVAHYEEQLLVSNTSTTATSAASPAPVSIDGIISATTSASISAGSSGSGSGTGSTRGRGRGIQALSARHAFQLWFDLKYLRALLIPLSRLATLVAQDTAALMTLTISSTLDGVGLVADGDKETSAAPCWERLDALIVRLEAVIDPFDLHVFLPYLQRNLRLHLHRTSVLTSQLNCIRIVQYVDSRCASNLY